MRELLTIVLGVLIGNVLTCGFLAALIKGEELTFRWRFQRRTGQAFTADISRSSARQRVADAPPTVR